MTRLRLIFSVVLALGIAPAQPLRAAGRGDEVVVVFNTRLPESREIAEHYAALRQVPSAQVIGFDLPTTEAISRQDYAEELENPLARTLEDKHLFEFGPREFPGTNGVPQRVEHWVIAAKIRYLVLCYGVPLKITADPLLREEGASSLPAELARNDAAVDNELACLPHLGQHFLRSGPLTNPHYRSTNAPAMNPTNGILLVARLDGPTAPIARALVDKAMQAETEGLWGRAYFDLRGLTNGPYVSGDESMRAAAEVSRLVGFETVVDDKPDCLPVAFPLSQVALYAGWYNENASGPFSRPTVEFMNGAFAYHLFSFSAQTIRSTTRFWVGPLLAKGVTATMGCVEEPYLSGTPDMGVFFARFLYSGFTFGEAAYASQRSLSWQTTVVGDPLYRPFGRSPDEQRVALERSHSKLVEWFYLRALNVRLASHSPLATAIAALNGLPLTRQSAVLSEKLAALYAAHGQPASSVSSLQDALKLNPSPQQHVRLALNLASQLLALKRDDEAFAVYEQFLKDVPDYPDPAPIYRDLANLARKLGKPDALAKYQHELARFAPPR